MAQWVTAEQILAHAGVTSPTPADEEWSAVCADAVCAGIDERLVGSTWISLPTYPTELPAELLAAARGAGVEAYKRREAVFGITGYVDLAGAAVRVSRDYLAAIEPIIARYATVGIA
jgi:hypothetical protein